MAVRTYATAAVDKYFVKDRLESLRCCRSDHMLDLIQNLDVSGRIRLVPLNAPVAKFW